MPIGRPGDPGPGFVPLLVGILMAAMSVALFIQSFRVKISENKALGLDKRQQLKVYTTSLSLIIYALALRPLGFIFATLLLLVFLFKVIGELKWKVSIAGPILITAFFYLLFKVWLEVQFPIGPFGV